MRKQPLKNEKQALPLGSVNEKLLELFETQEIPSLINCYKRVFELATFFSMLELSDYDITSLHAQYVLIETLQEIVKENETPAVA